MIVIRVNYNFNCKFYTLSYFCSKLAIEFSEICLQVLSLNFFKTCLTLQMNTEVTVVFYQRNIETKTY